MLHPSFSHKANVTDAWGNARSASVGAFVHSACKRGTAPASAKGVTKLRRRGTTPRQGGHGPLTTPLALTLGLATGLCLSLLCLLLSHGDSVAVAVTAAVSAIHCTAAIAEPLPVQNHPQTLQVKAWTRSGWSGTPHMFSQVMMGRGRPSAGGGQSGQHGRGRRGAAWALPSPPLRERPSGRSSGRAEGGLKTK